ISRAAFDHIERALLFFQAEDGIRDFHVTGVQTCALPIYTAAHHSIRVESAGSSALVTGDAFHHPVQIARPEWSSQGDWDGEVSARTRRKLLEEFAGTDTLLLGTHFADDVAGYIVSDGDGFRLVATLAE